jgi:predicted restriction endonuclease
MPKVTTDSVEESWETLIDGLRDGRGANKDVVHRPLLTLMLLARAQQGEPNEVRFNDLDPPFREVIDQFAPSRYPSGLEYPFWYLQRNYFWVVQNPDILPRVKNKDRPSRRGLIKYNAKGLVRAGLWDELLKDPARIERLAEHILDEFWPDVPRKRIAYAVGLTVRERGGES